jgi:tetratricopeptide (TPR) repeat protein
MSPRRVRFLTFTVLGLSLAGTAFAQSRGSAPTTGSTGGSTGSTGAGATTGSLGRTTTSLPGTTSPTTSPSTLPRPIFLSGKVAIDDGTPLPEPVPILRVCNGNPHTEGYTDLSGSFGIEFGNEQGVIQDAETANSGSQMGGMGGAGTSGAGSGGMGSGGLNSSNNSMTFDRRMMNCELQARLAGYRSQGVILAGRQPLDNPDVGTILLHRTSKSEEGNTVSAKSLAAPKDARRAFEKGLELAKKNKVSDAFHEFQKAVMLYPAYATAWCELGKIEVAIGQLDIARGSFQQAVKADPKYVDPYLELSRMALNDKNWPELAEFTGKALELDSFDYPQEFLFDAVAHYNMHDYDSAQKSVLRAETLDSRHEFPQISYLKGLVQIQHKEYAAAAANLRAYLKAAPDAEDGPKVREQLAQLDKYLAQTASKQ